MNELKEHNMKLVNVATSLDRYFLHYLLGWMGNEHHKEMAECARSYLSDQFAPHGESKGRTLLAEFDAKNSLSEQSEVQ